MKDCYQYMEAKQRPACYEVITGGATTLYLDIEVKIPDPGDSIIESIVDRARINLATRHEKLLQSHGRGLIRERS